MSLRRHFTVTTFVSAEGATLLHWHRKVQLWLPPGGHIEADEDPIQAAQREALEETGIVVEILPTAPSFAFPDPPQLPPPAVIMLEPIGAHGEEAAHQHIDFIYFARPASGEQAEPPDGWQWVTRAQLEADAPLMLNGVAAEISVDVRALGMQAIDRSAAARC